MIWSGRENELGSYHEINLWKKSKLFRRKDKIKNLWLDKADENLKKKELKRRQYMMWCLEVGDTRMICKMWRRTVNEFGLK